MQTRLARYYLGRLRAANTIYRRGATSSAEGTALLGQEWAQIAQWQAWAAAQSRTSAAAAHLCASFAQDGAAILPTRQTPRERVAWLESGLAAARMLGDARAEGVCLLHLAWAIHKETDLDRAEEVAGLALAQAEMIDDPLLIGQALHLLGEIAVRRSALERAEPLFLRSVEQLGSVDAQAALAEVYFSLSELTYFLGRPDEAHAYALQCHEIHRALGLNQITNNSLTWLGLMTIEAGDFARGEQYVRQSEVLARAAGAQSTLAYTLSTLSELMLIRKEADKARRYAEEAQQIAERVGEAWLIPGLLVHHGDAAAMAGDYEVALGDVGQAIDCVRANGYRETLVYALLHLADIQLTAGDLEAARAALREGMDAARQAQIYTNLVYGVFVATKLWRLRDAIRAAEWAAALSVARGLDYRERQDLQGLQAELAGVLGSETYQAAAERGTGLPIETAAECILQELGGPL